MKLYRVADSSALAALEPATFNDGDRVQLESDDSVHICREVDGVREFIASTDIFAADDI